MTWNFLHVSNDAHVIYQNCLSGQVIFFPVTLSTYFVKEDHSSTGYCSTWYSSLAGLFTLTFVFTASFTYHWKCNIKVHVFHFIRHFVISYFSFAQSGLPYVPFSGHVCSVRTKIYVQTNFFQRPNFPCFYQSILP